MLQPGVPIEGYAGQSDTGKHLFHVPVWSMLNSSQLSKSVCRHLPVQSISTGISTGNTKKIKIVIVVGIFGSTQPSHLKLSFRYSRSKIRSSCIKACVWHNGSADVSTFIVRTQQTSLNLKSVDFTAFHGRLEAYWAKCPFSQERGYRQGQLRPEFG